MDLKALMQKLETINKKEILTEAEKKETTWTDKSGKKHPATSVKGDKYTGKEAEKEDKPKKDDLDESILTSAIARELLKEFGLDEADAWTPTPEQEKWLGGANRQDPYIMSRMPGPKPPVTYFTDPADQEIAKKMNFGQSNLNSLKKMVGMNPGDAQAFADPTTATTPAAPAGGAATKPAAAAPATAAPTGTVAQGDDEGNTMITKPDGTVQVVGPDGNVIPPGGGKQPTASATAAPPAGGAGGDAAVTKTRERMKALLDKLEKTGGSSGAPAAPAAGAAAKPAAKPTGGAATKPAAPAGNSVDWNAIGAGQMTAESMLADDQTLLAIKNIRY